MSEDHIARWELYDGDTRELVNFGVDIADLPSAVMEMVGRNVIIVERGEDDLDSAVPWHEIQPKRVIDVGGPHAAAVNWLFLGLTLLADDMPQDDPMTERLDNLMDTFFSSVVEIPEEDDAPSGDG